eukprot:s3090_g4.t1
MFVMCSKRRSALRGGVRALPTFQSPLNPAYLCHVQLYRRQWTFNGEVSLSERFRMILSLLSLFSVFGDFKMFQALSFLPHHLLVPRSIGGRLKLPISSSR